MCGFFVLAQAVLDFEELIALVTLKVFVACLFMLFEVSFGPEFLLTFCAQVFDALLLLCP